MYLSNEWCNYLRKQLKALKCLQQIVEGILRTKQSDIVRVKVLKDRCLKDKRAYERYSL